MAALPTYKKYRLLAFVIAHKRIRRNSCIYQHDKIYKVAAKLGISQATYKSYRNTCINLGILRQRGTAYYFIKISKIVDTLDFSSNIPEKDMEHVQYFRGLKYKGCNFNRILTELQFNIADVNFKKQEYFNARAKEILNTLGENRYKTRLTKRQRGKIDQRAKRYAKKMGISPGQLFNILLSLPLEYIRTGKRHIARLLGVSASTATLRIQKWVKEKMINRKVNKRYIPESEANVNPYSYESLIHQHKVVIPCSHGGYLVVDGSLLSRPKEKRNQYIIDYRLLRTRK